MLLIVLTSFVANTFARQSSKPSEEHSSSSLPLPRIDCYPEAESNFSNYSKESCLARGCLYDGDAQSGAIQCYLQPNYGYTLQKIEQQTNTSLRLKLERNKKVPSMFPAPIENVILEVQHYTNDILRFKLYDADHQRYEVGLNKDMYS
jgi:hypothetical protein